MTDMWTDDEIADLFASANPIPTGRSGPDRSAPERQSGVQDGAVVFDLDDHPLVRLDDRPRDRWWLVVGVAAAVALVVSLLVTTAVDNSPQPADEPGTTLPGRPPVVGLSANVAVVESFVDAVTRHDIDAAEAVVAPGETLAISLGSTLPDRSTAELADQFVFLEAVGWWWEVERCNDIADDHVWCRIRHHDRLSEYTGVEATGTAEFWLSDDLIRDARVQAHLGDYGTEAFMPFITWVTVQYPDDVDRMVMDAWNGDLAPILDDESAALFDAHLTEYLGINSDDLGVGQAYEFVAALNGGDVEAARARLVAGHLPRLVWAQEGPEDVPTLDDQFAWLQAFGTAWERPTCSASSSTTVRCTFQLRNRLADAQTGSALPAVAMFSLRDGAIELTNDPPVYPGMTYDAFIYWVNATDPEVAHRIWVNGDENEIVTEESAVRAARRLIGG